MSNNNNFTKIANNGRANVPKTLARDIDKRTSMQQVLQEEEEEEEMSGMRASIG